MYNAECILQNVYCKMYIKIVYCKMEYDHIRLTEDGYF